MKSVLFRRQATLFDLKLDDGWSCNFRQHTPPIEVILTQPVTGLPWNAGKKAGRTCVATATTEEELSGKVFEQLQTITEAWANAGDARPSQIPSIPEAVTQLTKRIESDLMEFVRRVATTIRWRRQLTSRPNPVKSVKFLQWSSDGRLWHHTPVNTNLTLVIGKPSIPLTDDNLAEIKDLLDRGQEEPVARELLLEAMGLMDQNPRSALVVGIAAAEVGLKEFISALVPDVKWLAFNAPSPPLVQIIEEYLPTLPVQHRLGPAPGVDPFIPKCIIDRLRKGVRLRNQISHAGKEVQGDEVRETVYAAAELLHLLGTYRGHVWALDGLTPPTREELDEEIKRRSAKRRDRAAGK